MSGYVDLQAGAGSAVFVFTDLYRADEQGEMQPDPNAVEVQIEVLDPDGESVGIKTLSEGAVETRMNPETGIAHRYGATFVCPLSGVHKATFKSSVTGGHPVNTSVRFTLNPL